MVTGLPAAPTRPAPGSAGPGPLPPFCCDDDNGAAAPLNDYQRILSSDALMLIDDAHGGGVLGETGQGTLEHTGLTRNRVIQTLTLSQNPGVSPGHQHRIGPNR